MNIKTKTSIIILFLVSISSAYSGVLKIKSEGIQYCLIEVAAIRFATSPQQSSIFSTRSRPSASAGGVHKVGRQNNFSNVSWQVGCKPNEGGFPREEGVLVYNYSPRLGSSTFINIHFSSKNHLATSNDRIFVLYNDDVVASFTPVNTGSWNTYTSVWLDISSTSTSASGHGSIDFSVETQGQDYAVAMIESLELSNSNKTKKKLLTANSLSSVYLASQPGLNKNYQPNSASSDKSVLSMGAQEHSPWRATYTTAKFDDISSNLCNLKLIYSKNSPSSTPLVFRFGSRNFRYFPRKTGSWNSFRTATIDMC